MVLLVGTVTEVRSLASAEDIAALSPDLRERAPHFFGTEATLQVDSYWSGAQLRSAIVVQTGNVGGGCGVPWNPGECFFIEAWLEDGLWKTSTCSMTAPIAAARETLEKLIVTDGPGKRTSK